MRLVWVAALCLPDVALAWEVLDGAGIEAALTDRTLVYEGDITQTFRASGVTEYIVRDVSLGRWAVRADQYCSVWPPSDRWDCYIVEAEGVQIRFVASDGSVSVGTYAP